MSGEALPSSVSVTLEREQDKSKTYLKAPCEVSYSFHVPMRVSQEESSLTVKGGKYKVLVKYGREEIARELYIPLPRRFMKEHVPFKVIFTEPERPWRLAVDQQQRIYFTGNTSSSYSIMGPGYEEPKRIQCKNMIFARGIAVATENGATVVYITGNHKLQKYEGENLVGEIGCLGSEVNQFNDPNGVCVHKGKVYVCDSINYRVQVFLPDLRGKDTKVIGRDTRSLPGYRSAVLYHPEDLDFDSQGNMYVVDSMNHSVVVFTSNGEYSETIVLEGSLFPVSLRIFRDVDNKAYFCVSVRDQYCIMVYSIHGVFIRKVGISYDKNKTPGRGSLRLLASGKRRSISYVPPNPCQTKPLGIAVDCDEFLYVACSNCNEIQVFE